MKSAKFYYGFDVDHIEIPIEKVKPVNIEKRGDEKKVKLIIDLQFKDRKLELVIDDLFCNIEDHGLLNAVIKGDNEKVASGYYFEGETEFSDEEFKEFKTGIEKEKSDDVEDSDKKQ